MTLLPNPTDVTLWISEVFKQCVFSVSTGIGALCIIVYLLAIMALAMEGKVEFQAKKYAIGSLITYFLSKAILFLFV